MKRVIDERSGHCYGVATGLKTAGNLQGRCQTRRGRTLCVYASPGIGLLELLSRDVV